MKRHIFLFLLGFMCANTLLLASPSIKGPTGLVMMPTAEVIAFQKVEMAYDYDLKEENLKKLRLENPDKNYEKLFSESSYKINIGTFKNFELGINGGSQPDEGMFLNTKYLMLVDSRSEYPISLAVGTMDLGSEKNASAYAVVSKPFPKDMFSVIGLKGMLHLHFGVKGMFHKEFDSGIMAGIEYYPLSWFKVMTDFVEERDRSYWNAGLELTLMKHVGIRISGLDISDERFSRYNAGLSFNFFM